MLADKKALLDRVMAFEIDEPGVDLTFERRLARENGWTLEFAQRVTREYKRFAFLAVAAGHPVTPSDEVDQAWHLHLTYTQSYWQRFCTETLGMPLHHHPTRGGSAEGDKFLAWYKQTLASYAECFDHPAPSDIWPDAEQRFQVAGFVRLDRRRHWVIAKPHWLTLCWLSVVQLGFAGAAFGATGGGETAVSGPVFLLWFFIGSVVMFLFAGFLRRKLRLPDREPKPDDVPADLHLTAMLCTGPVGMVNAAVIRLQQAGALVVGQGRVVTLQPNGPLPEGVHPFEQLLYKLVADARGMQLSEVRKRLAAALAGSKEELKRRGLLVGDATARRVILIPLGVAMIMPVFGLLRIAWGFLQDRPVGFLMIGTAIAGLTGLACFGRRPKRSRLGEAVVRLVRQQYSNLPKDVAKRSKLADPDLLALAAAVFGLKALAGTSAADLERRLTPQGMSSCGGGYGMGCGDAGSCGGGCGGGGCGGCGGG
jgi:uncharacterized protein (TIGR04222 family)